MEVWPDNLPDGNGFHNNSIDNFFKLIRMGRKEFSQFCFSFGTIFGGNGLLGGRLALPIALYQFYKLMVDLQRYLQK